MSKKNIIFLGTPEFALNTLKDLYKNHNVNLVVTQPDRANKRGKKIEYNPIKKFAIDNNLEIFQPEDINSEESISKLSKYETDYIVVVAYGQIIKEEVRNLAKKKIVNIHASLLPKYRGAAPIQRSIMNRDIKTGVCIMEVSEGLDKGDVFLCDELKIEDKKYPEIHDELSIMGSKLLLDFIDQYENNNIKVTKQDEEFASYAKKINKEDGLLNFRDIDTEIGKINGLYPKPGAYFIYEDKKVKVLDGEVFSNNSDFKTNSGTILDVLKDGILVNCENGILKINKIQFPGKNPTSVEDYLKGNTIEKNIEIG